MRHNCIVPAIANKTPIACDQKLWNRSLVLGLNNRSSTSELPKPIRTAITCRYAYFQFREANLYIWHRIGRNVSSREPKIEEQLLQWTSGLVRIKQQSKKKDKHKLISPQSCQKGPNTSAINFWSNLSTNPAAAGQ